MTTVRFRDETKPCVRRSCGHAGKSHNHYTPGLWCSVPGCSCQHYRRPGWWSSWLTLALLLLVVGLISLGIATGRL